MLFFGTGGSLYTNQQAYHYKKLKTKPSRKIDKSDSKKSKTDKVIVANKKKLVLVLPRQVWKTRLPVHLTVKEKVAY